MCRWLAYSGGPIHLEDVLLKPEHSLIDQSLEASLSPSTTNGDGFGIGWYGDRKKPGVYKDIQPAWNDGNLKTIAEQIESSMFLAHVRATTGTPVQRSNCHPFLYKNWIFVHNGLINNLTKVKRDLILEISPELFPLIQGSTDSEIMFYLALTFGMEDNVFEGVSHMVGLVEKVGKTHNVKYPMQMSLGICDGESIFGFRYSSEGSSRTLFYSGDIGALREVVPEARRFTDDAKALVSEPLSHREKFWTTVPESSFIRINKGSIDIEKFTAKVP